MLKIRLKAVQSIISICQHADRSVSTSLIHGVAANILQHVIHCAENADCRPTDELELGIVIEGMKLSEVLVAVADEQTSKPLFIKKLAFLERS